MGRGIGGKVDRNEKETRKRIWRGGGQEKKNRKRKIKGVEKEKETYEFGWQL